MVPVRKETIEFLPNECIIRLLSIYDTLKKAERSVADLLLNNPSVFAEDNISEVAGAAGCSDPTVVRLLQKLGYEGFADFKKALMRPSNEHASWYHDGVTTSDNFESTMEKILHSAIQGLTDTFKYIDQKQLKDAIRTLLNAERIIIFGVGDSAVTGRFMQYNLAKLGLNAFFSEDTDFTSYLAFLMNENDVFFAISHSGMSETTVKMAERAKTCGGKVICLTNYPKSPLAKISEIVLLTAVFTEHMYSMNSSKRVAQMCVIETIIANLILIGQGKLRNGLNEISDFT